MEKTVAEKLAFILNWLVQNGRIPGLHPKDVLEAANMLVEQEKELQTLRAALATKGHLVAVDVDEKHYRMRVRGTFTITDPRIYCGEVTIDPLFIETANEEWMQHEARHLTRVATKDWMRELDEKTYVSLRNALTAHATSPNPTGAHYGRVGREGANEMEDNELICDACEEHIKELCYVSIGPAQVVFCFQCAGYIGTTPAFPAHRVICAARDENELLNIDARNHHAVTCFSGRP